MIRFARIMHDILSLNDNRRLTLLKRVSQLLLPDYRLSWSQLDWWNDPQFNAYLDYFGEREGFNTHRKWMLWQLLRLVGHVSGDTAECGTFEGASSWLICAADPAHKRKHHLFDSFEGLSEPESVDGSHWKAGDMAAGEDVVQLALKPFADQLVFHKGWIPARFCDVESRAFSFVHVDLDLRQPTLDSVEFFYPRLSPGGILLCDDYGFRTCPGATNAIDEFLSDKPEKMISLDAGGGFFIKGTEAAVPMSPIPTISAGPASSRKAAVA